MEQKAGQYRAPEQVLSAAVQLGEKARQRRNYEHFAGGSPGGAVYIDKHYKTGEGNEEQISVVGRVNPEQGGVEYRVEFSELGRPPAYDGKTALTIGPRERRVLVLPAIELDSAKKLQTVVALQYRVEEKDNGLKSKFEIK